MVVGRRSGPSLTVMGSVLWWVAVCEPGSVVAVETWVVRAKQLSLQRKSLVALTCCDNKYGVNV